jgi:hypothetical protein
MKRFRRSVAENILVQYDDAWGFTLGRRRGIFVVVCSFVYCLFARQYLAQLHGDTSKITCTKDAETMVISPSRKYLVLNSGVARVGRRGAIFGQTKGTLLFFW